MWEGESRRAPSDFFRFLVVAVGVEEKESEPDEREKEEKEEVEQKKKKKRESKLTKKEKKEKKKKNIILLCLASPELRLASRLGLPLPLIFSPL